MVVSKDQQKQLRQLPGVDRVLDWMKSDALAQSTPKSVLVEAIRQAIDQYRSRLLSGNLPDDGEEAVLRAVCDEVKQRITDASKPKLQQVINATGIVIHTNLGRSLLAAEAVENLERIAGKHSNLEFDLSLGKRGSRHDAVSDILCSLTGAEAAIAVNNNAGAVLLCLDTIARNTEVIVSRGELVEIGGSFRIPDVMAKSGTKLKEVGTTNRTHLADYEKAIESDTGLLLKVHTSNYAIEGFTREVPLTELVGLGRRYGIPVMKDLGSGTLIDFRRYGLIREPTVQEVVAAGPDLITFSGDKLLGGPQAGIILGKEDILASIKGNPLARALRIDKLTLAGLESTLRLYRDPEAAVDAIPTLRMLTMPIESIEHRADILLRMLSSLGDTGLSVRKTAAYSRAGGGSLPRLKLPTFCIELTMGGMSANSVERQLREHTPPIIGRIEEGMLLMDPRTLNTDELEIIANAISDILKRADT